MRYFVIYKPFQVISQFSPEGDKVTLASLSDFPKDVYPVGRLDYDSEGLLILTNDKRLNHALLDPIHSHQREYWIQVENTPTDKALSDLENGVDISIEGKTYRTSPAKASIIEGEPALPERNPPIRFRKNIPTSWISLSLEEGKNRQVRKMTAAVGLPTLRLVRYSIEDLSIDQYKSGEVKEYTKNELLRLLHLA